MTTTTTFSALCNAINNGDEFALLVLADLFEENGDRRAEYLRAASEYEPAKMSCNRATWNNGEFEEFSAGDELPSVLPSHIFNRLEGLCGRQIDRIYLSRSAAYFALAEALMKS